MFQESTSYFTPSFFVIHKFYSYVVLGQYDVDTVVEESFSASVKRLFLLGFLFWWVLNLPLLHFN